MDMARLECNNFQEQELSSNATTSAKALDKREILYQVNIKELDRVSNTKYLFYIYTELVVFAWLYLTYSKGHMFYIKSTCDNYVVCVVMITSQKTNRTTKINL